MSLDLAQIQKEAKEFDDDQTNRLTERKKDFINKLLRIDDKRSSVMYNKLYDYKIDGDIHGANNLYRLLYYILEQNVTEYTWYEGELINDFVDKYRTEINKELKKLHAHS